MSDTPREGGQTPEMLTKRAKFEALYRDWHAARADFYDDNLQGDAESTSARSDRCEAAERALLTTPAPLPCCVFLKWEALDCIVTDEAEDGPDVDNRVIVALASIKADVVRFGLKDPQ